MTNTFFLAAEHLPLETAPHPLLPPLYDVVWSLVPFLIILFVFWKLVLPKFQEVLHQREDQIEGGIQRAEAAQAEAKAALEKYNSQLAEARTEAAQIRDDARSQGQRIIADMKAQATDESNRIVESGNKQLEAQRAAVVSDLRKDMGENSISLAERLLGEQLSDDVKRSGTIDSFLADLDRVGSARK
ncbi:F0F1 ATP synthase subunit B [Corynebacterium suicordis]|uniref:ATP synthase subunit b n=1 Tax=Corynebacterium suicordis DSM 45110 TaxID=1121369 RepID=A0ABR9ZJA3_9CORY|nr:F0F1 ATP synthase subunit B [Corynebacterium suicordis]MBF4553289.1 F0F1 ATP synthase subunit B [Corynebacterium suicordis DSM 45110]MDR6277741.1 F-type H+-transporting ATPase subunit b [Corynebacterium suicordis]